MTVPGSDRVDESLIALRRILRAAELYARGLAQAVGVTPAQLRVLQIVAAREGGATPTRLATQMGVTQATITALVDKLVAGAKVTRVRSQADRRQTNIVVTKTGVETLRAMPDALQQRYVKAFDTLQDWEQAQLVSSLERVADMLDAGDIDASPVLTIGDIKGGGSGALRDISTSDG